MASLKVGEELKLPKNSSIANVAVVEHEDQLTKIEYTDLDISDEWVATASLLSYNGGGKDPLIGVAVIIPKNSTKCLATVKECKDEMALVSYKDGQFEDDWILRATVVNYMPQTPRDRNSLIGVTVTIPKHSTRCEATVIGAEEDMLLVKYKDKVFDDEWIVRAAVVSCMPKPSRPSDSASFIVVGATMLLPKFSSIAQVKIIQVEETLVKIEYICKSWDAEWVTVQALDGFNKEPAAGDMVFVGQNVQDGRRSSLIGKSAKLPKYSTRVTATVVQVDGQLAKVRYEGDFSEEWVIKDAVVVSLESGSSVVSVDGKAQSILSSRRQSKRKSAAEGEKSVEFEEKAATVPDAGAAPDPPVKEPAQVEKPPKRSDIGIIHGHDETALKRVWHSIDKSRTGYIEENDLADAMRSIGLFVSDREAGQIIMKSGREKGKKVSFDEWLGFLRARPKDNEDRLRKAFRRFDLNNDGQIDTAELRAALTTQGEKLTDAEVDEMLAGMDINGDGKVDFEEFVKSLLC